MWGWFFNNKCEHPQLVKLTVYFHDFSCGGRKEMGQTLLETDVSQTDTVFPCYFFGAWTVFDRCKIFICQGYV